jgi:hypothetical protein
MRTSNWPTNRPKRKAGRGRWNLIMGWA